MTLRTKIFFFGGIILIFIIGLILALVYRNRLPLPENTPVNQAVNAPAGGDLPGGGATTVVVPEKKVTLEEVKAVSAELLVKNVAKNFVERFGSYSQEAEFSNFKEIADLVTPTVAAWLEKYPADLLKKLPGGFEGVSTRVVSQNIESLDGEKAVLMVSTQREERVNGATRVYYQDMKVNLVLRDGVWLVDGAYWQ